MGLRCEMRELFSRARLGRGRAQTARVDNTVRLHARCAAAEMTRDPAEYSSAAEYSSRRPHYIPPHPKTKYTQILHNLPYRGAAIPGRTSASALRPLAMVRRGRPSGAADAGEGVIGVG